MKVLCGVALELDAVEQPPNAGDSLHSSIRGLVTSHPVTKSLRVVMQVVMSGKPLDGIGRKLDAVYEHGLHIT